MRKLAGLHSEQATDPEQQCACFPFLDFVVAFADLCCFFTDRDLERKLGRLHSEQARSAGHVQALSAVASALPWQQLPAATPPASSAGSNSRQHAETEAAEASLTHSRGGSA